MAVQLGMFAGVPPAPDPVADEVREVPPQPASEPAPWPAAPIQLGMFGAAEVADVHVVSAHFRVLASGDEVFVGEHLRNNRGRTGERLLPRRPVAEPPPAGQLGMFAG